MIENKWKKLINCYTYVNGSIFTVNLTQQKQKEGASQRFYASEEGEKEETLKFYQNRTKSHEQNKQNQLYNSEIKMFVLETYQYLTEQKLKEN